MLGKRVKKFLLSRRLRNSSGSAAIEFAFVAPVFFMILLGIIEGGVMFFGQAALMNSTQDAARLMGHPYRISGHVVHGRKLGRELGFKTLNLVVGHGLHQAQFLAV